MTKTWCAGGKRYSKTDNITQKAKVNLRTKKLFKIIKGSCRNCGCNKSQLFIK